MHKKVFAALAIFIMFALSPASCNLAGDIDELRDKAHTHSYAYTVTSTTYPAQSIQTCTCGKTIGVERDTEISDIGPGCGIIFYIASSGFAVTGAGSFTANYLEAAPANTATTLAWASISFNSTNITGTLTAIGTGKENTRLILATDANAPAAKACKDYSNNGKSDWFLPSKDELNEMYKARSHLGISSGYFWSSSQYNLNYAWLQDFFDGFRSDHNKPNDLFVRAIRAF